MNHYLAYLVVPAVACVALLVVQINVLVLDPEHREVRNTFIDSEFNGLFGFCLAIWSTFFVESWRSREKMLAFEWDLDILKAKYAGSIR